jgi:DNA ligase (NAD+)
MSIKIKRKRSNKTRKKLIDFEIVEEKTIEPKKQIKRKVQLEIMEEPKRYNEEFIDLMEKLTNIMLKQGEPFRARAYQKAQETIMAYPSDITNTNQLKGLPGIGTTILEKLNEYVERGTLRVLEREKTNPINILGEIYGIGPKKAKELVDAGITSIDQLKENQNELLNDIQKVGLRYHEEIQKRIPRSEIQEYEEIFNNIFKKVATNSSSFEIVGSYRRGALSSGDIDVIITGQNNDIYKKFVQALIKEGIIIEVLSRGQSKTLVIARLPNGHDARRIDFLYSPPNEYAFALLYFTGSKIFNTVMRQYALNKGYTFNEHGIYVLVDKTKGEKVDQMFPNEKSIFDFLGLQYKAPEDRKDGRAVVPYIDVGEEKEEEKKDVEPTEEIIIKPKQKTLKKRKKIVELEVIDTESHIEQFKHDGITVLEQLNENMLTKMIQYANDAYYNKTQIMTDNQYDIMKEYVNQKYPQNIAVLEIGAKVEKNKVRLPYEMASMDKIKPDTNALSNWMIKYNGPYVLSCKLDGVSGLYSTQGTKPKLYTRGDGIYGQDISHLIPYLRLPKTKNIVIRGEFIIPKEVFEEKYKTRFANPRNMVAGLINHKTINEAISDVHFVAYEVIMPQLTPSEQMNYLTTLNVERVLNVITNTLSNEILSNLLVDWRSNYMYEIDGIIVTDDQLYPRTSGNPDHAFAFKMVLSDQVAEALVVDVLWSPSKDGYLKPRVQIEPINLGGVRIEYATGFNGAYILDNKIGVGATIKLIRSGDVIPHIVDVIVPAPEAKMPNIPYKWNESHVDIMLEDISTDPIVRLKNITGFFKGIEVEGLSSGNILRIINAGYDSVPKIINMSVQDLLDIEGFKEKMANKIYNGIHSKLNEATIIKLMSASNIFGRGFSEKKIETIMMELPDILVSNETQEQKIDAISNVKMMSRKTAELFVSHIEDFKSFIIECGLENKLYETPEKQIISDISHPLYNKKIVLTGTRDKNIIEYLQNIGAIQGSSVGRSTFLVIAKDIEDETGKVLEAKKLNIPIMSVEQFITTYMS